MACAWVEKYRPRTLREVILPTETRERLDKLKTSPDMPHLLMHGPPGTGKTSTAFAMCREMFGPKISERLVELNASDKRGINVVRGTIKSKASAAIGAADPDYPCPAFRVILLDEADAMTDDAQAALLKIMEEHSLTTRFILICNYINNMLHAILSRCPAIQLKPISHTDMAKRLQKIAEHEGIPVSSDVLDTIVEISEGDMRVAITTLQNTVALRAARGEPTRESVLDMVGLMPIEKIRKMVVKIDSLVAAQQLARQIECDALPIHIFLQVLTELVLSSDKPYSNILLQISTADVELARGANAYLQMLSLLTQYWIRYVRAPVKKTRSSSSKKKQG